VANSGRLNVELDLPGLAKASDGDPADVRSFGQEYRTKDRSVFLLGEGRLINLAAVERHRASVMDMSFANQALASEYLLMQEGRLERKVYRIPEEIDVEIAALKLQAMGIEIDELTEEQVGYLSSWTTGT